MRVLHLHSGNLYGGIEKTAVTIARLEHLCPVMRHSFALCFEGQMSRELATLKSPTHFLGGVRIRHPLQIWRARRRLADLFHAERFDVVIVHAVWSQAIFGPVIRAAGVPLVFWLHDVPSAGGWLENWAGQTPPDSVLCNSRFTASALSTLYPQISPIVYYNPVAPHVMPPAWVGSGEVRREFDTAPEATVIIQVSRMEAWKGHEQLLRALASLRDLPDWVCWQVGGSQRPSEERYFAGLKKLAGELGITEQVKFIGQRFDVPRLLSAADIHCQPNLGAEPFGNTFVEGLSAGLPVVTVDLGGAREIVDETCGILVPPGDTERLAAALRLLIEQPETRRRLGAAGPAQAHRISDPQTQMNKLRDVLSSAIHRRQAA